LDERADFAGDIVEAAFAERFVQFRERERV